MIQPLFIGTTELLVIAALALLLFGGKKLPEMMRGLGQGIKEFKQGMNDVKIDSSDKQVKRPVGEQGNAPSKDVKEDGE